MKSEAWIYLVGGILIASLLLREPLLFIVSLILMLIAGVSRIWQRYCLVGLGYQRRFGQTRAFFGEDVPLTIEIANDKPLPLAWLEIEDAVPGAGHARRTGPHGAVLHAWSAPAVDAAFGALVRARSPPLSRPLRHARLSPVRARDAANGRRVRLRDARARNPNRGLLARLPQAGAPGPPRTARWRPVRRRSASPPVAVRGPAAHRRRARVSRRR